MSPICAQVSSSSSSSSNTMQMGSSGWLGLSLFYGFIPLINYNTEATALNSHYYLYTPLQLTPPHHRDRQIWAQLAVGGVRVGWGQVGDWNCFKFIMSEEKDRHFQRSNNRFLKSAPRREVNESVEVRTSILEFEVKDRSQGQPNILDQSYSLTEERTGFSLSPSALEALKKWGGATRGELPSLLKDKPLRNELKKEEKRLAKMRVDNKVRGEMDNEVCIVAVNALLALAEEQMGEKPEKVENKVRANLEKEMARQLAVVDEQIELGNFAAVKATIQALLKRFGKDQFLQGKIGYLNYMLTLTDSYEREAATLRESSAYLDKLSTVDPAPENLTATLLMLRNLKKELTTAANRENKKPEPNERLVASVADVDKLAGLLLGYLEPKGEKKAESKPKREVELEKEIAERVKAAEFSEEANRCCREWLEKVGEGREEVYKELQVLRRNKKKAGQPPYNFILKIYDSVVASRKQANEANLYLKAASLIYQRKNLTPDNLLLELKKCQQKYATNELIATIKSNLEVLIANVQERERVVKEVSAGELEVKRLRKENERLEKALEDARKGERVEERVDKKKELEEKRARDAERMRAEKEEKDIEKSLDNIYANLNDKKWKPAKNAINVFLKRFEQSTNPTIPRSLTALSSSLAILQDLQTYQIQINETEKREKQSLLAADKEKQGLTEKIRQLQEWQGLVRDLLSNYNEQKYGLKKYFDDLRKDRRKIVQERYQLLAKLEEPMLAWKNRKNSEDVIENKNISLNLSSFSQENQMEKAREEAEEMRRLHQKEKEKNGQLEARIKEADRKIKESDNKIKELEGKLKETDKVDKGDRSRQTDELMQLVGRIEKGGEWWKLLPNNRKNSSFKPIYTLLQRNRENELQIQKYQVNESLFQEEGKAITNALDAALALISTADAWYPDEFWEKKLANYRGQPSCDKLITCLRQLNSKGSWKLAQQRKNFDKSVASYEAEIQQLSTAINDLQRTPRDKNRDSSSSKLQESSSKKSVDLRSSRKSSKSREKDSSKLKEAMQEYIQEERNLLSKIEQLVEQNQNLELKAAAIEKELIQAETRAEALRVEAENCRYEFERTRMTQQQHINELQGELEISEGRRTELENRYESELTYYREMYTQLSLKLQQSKERELSLAADLENFKQENELLLRRYEADVIVTVQEMKNEISSLKIELDTYRMNIRHSQQEKSKEEEIDWKAVAEMKERVVQEQQAAISGLQQQLTEKQQYRVHSTQQIQQQEVDVEKEVQAALKSQEEQFNEYLKKLQIQRMEYLMKEVLPAEVEAVITSRGLSHFSHNDWIQTEFPRLYEQRHQRQCANAGKTEQSVIQVKLEEFQTQELPRILAAERQQWLVESEAEWAARVLEIENYWINVAIPEKERQWRQAYDQLLASQMPTTATIVSHHEELAEEPTTPVEVKVEKEVIELELLSQLREEKNRWILDTLIDERKNEWEYIKEEEWANRVRDIENYWETVIVPDRRAEWEREQQNKLQAQPQPEPIIVAAPSIDPEVIIEEWKAQHLQAIITYQVNFAVKTFIDTELPRILEQEYQGWVASLPPQPNVELILQQEHAQWQASLPPTPPQPNIDFIIQQEHVKWIAEKAQEISRIQSDFANRLKEVEKSLQALLVKQQQKSQRQKQRADDLQSSATRFKTSELPILLSRQRERSVEEFKDKELGEIIRQVQADWQSNHLLQIVNKESNRWILDTLVTERKVVWEQQQNEQQKLQELNYRRERELMERNFAEERREWQLQREQEYREWESIRNHEQMELQHLRAALQAKDQAEGQTAIDLQRWEREKAEEWTIRVREIENYWENVILPEREEERRKGQLQVIEEVITTKLAEQQKQFSLLLSQERQAMELEKHQLVETQRQIWLNELPQLLLSPLGQRFIEPHLVRQGQQYEAVIRTKETELSNEAGKVRQLQGLLKQSEARQRDWRTKCQAFERQTILLRNDHQNATKRSVEDSQRLNEELTRSKWVENQVQELTKIINKQKEELSSHNALIRQMEALKQDNLTLKEAAIAADNAKWREVNELKNALQAKLFEYSNERGQLISKISELEGARRDGVDRQAHLSLERQVGTLSATLKTKDAEISFLKKTVDSLNIEIREYRDRVAEQLQRRNSAQRGVTELKSSHLQLSYQLKYLKEREESLLKRCELKQQQMGNLRKKCEYETDLLEKKLKANLEMISSFQIKFNEMESILAIKSKEYMAAANEADKFAYDNQKLEANAKLHATENDALRRQLRETESRYAGLQIEFDRTAESVRSARMQAAMFQQQQEELKMVIDDKNRAIAQADSLRKTLQHEYEDLKQQMAKLWSDLDESERSRRREAERAAVLQGELHQAREAGCREVDASEIDMLKRINKEVSELTAVNRQLELKASLLESRQKITTFSSEVINYFLLVQRYTDSLVDYLFREGIVPDLQPYHQFLSDAKPLLVAGRPEEYFQQWQKALTALFTASIASRSEEIRAQAEELLRLRDEMTEVLDRQIELGDGECAQLVEDYKAVLGDVKSLVVEFLRTGQRDYLQMLCGSLGITR